MTSGTSSKAPRLLPGLELQPRPRAPRWPSRGRSGPIGNLGTDPRWAPAERRLAACVQHTTCFSPASPGETTAGLEKNRFDQAVKPTGEQTPTYAFMPENGTLPGCRGTASELLPFTAPISQHKSVSLPPALWVPHALYPTQANRKPPQACSCLLPPAPPTPASRAPRSGPVRKGSA